MPASLARLDALDWPRLAAPGARIVCSHMTAEPAALLRALADSRAHDGRFDIVLGVPFTDAAAAFPAHTRFTTFGAMGSAGRLARSHDVQMSIAHYSACERIFDAPDTPVDLLLASLARGADGRLYLGAAHGYALAAARRARCIVAEVNAMAPAIAGAPWPDDLAIDHLVETAYPIAVAAAPKVSEIERRIAGHVATLVVDGACLQVGIGSLASAVVEGLGAHRSLGLHSGMLTPALHALLRSGAIDNSRKPLDAGRSVTACVYGDKALYDAVRDRADLILREPAYTHGAAVIAQLDDFVALNSALEVDLLGQANAESVADGLGGRRYVGGVGGLNDFVRGAHAARRGQAIVALPSRQPGADGRAGASRIVAQLSGPATIAASDADIVVTEHGIAHLRDAGVAARAARLIAIAHPDERAALRDAARRLGVSA